MSAETSNIITSFYNLLQVVRNTLETDYTRSTQYKCDFNDFNLMISIPMLQKPAVLNSHPCSSGKVVAKCGRSNTFGQAIFLLY